VKTFDRTGPVLLRRAVLVLVATLLVARPLVLGEGPGLTDGMADPSGMVLTLLWMIAATGWAAWRFWLRPRTGPEAQGTEDEEKAAAALGLRPSSFYGGLVQTALLVTVAIVSLSAELAAHYKFPARIMAWEWFGLFLTFFVVRQMAVTPAEQRGLFNVLLAGAVALAAHGIYQDRIELPDTRQDFGDVAKLREALARRGVLEDYSEGALEQYLLRLRQNNIFGPYAHPNSYAGYLALWLPGLIGAVVMCRRTQAPNWQTILAACCAALCGVALWLTHSRGALLGLLLAGLGVAVLLWRQTLRTHLALTLVSLFLLVGLAYGAWRGGLLTSGMGKDAGTMAVRLEYWRTTGRMIYQHPWLGVGLGNFSENYPRYMSETADEKIRDPHNFALEMWATSGVFAMLALLVVIVAFFVRILSWFANPLLATILEQPRQDVPHPLEIGRWDFYLGGMFGLLLAFVLRVTTAPPDEILGETYAAAIRAVVWFASYGLLERVAWSERGRALALTAGVAALLINLCFSGGIGFPSVAGPLWAAVALALSARPSEPSAWLSRPGAAQILPVPIFAALALGYALYLVYPVMNSDSLQREATLRAAYFRAEVQKPTNEQDGKIHSDPSGWLQRNVIGLLLESARLTPEDARIQSQLARWYGSFWELKLQTTRSSDPKAAELALAHADRCIRLDPEGGEGYWSKFHVLTLIGYYYEGVAQEGAKRDALRIHQLGRTAQKQYQEAAKVLEDYLPNDPTDAKLHFQIARAWFKAGESQKGRGYAEEARRLDEAVASPTRKLTDPQRKQIREWLADSPAG
jgi:hypothetical protein